MGRVQLWRDLLADFLRSVATAPEMEQFLRWRYHDINNSIDWSGMDPIIEIFEHLQRRGLLDAMFFTHLREWRPERVTDVDAIHAVWSVETGDETTATSLRRRIDRLFVDDAMFEAFCHDYLPQIQRRFSNGMDRTAKTTMVLRSVPPQTLLTLLHHWEQDNASNLQ